MTQNNTPTSLWQQIDAVLRPSAAARWLASDKVMEFLKERSKQNDNNN